MSIQSRPFSGPQTSPGNFVQPAPPSGVTVGNATLHSSSSSSFFHRYSPRDPFTLSAPPTTTVTTLPGTGGLFLAPSVNSHKGFVPARIGGTGKQETPILKPPKPPEKPLMPYMRYSRKMWEKVRSSNPDSKLWDIGKIIGQMWRELPDASRQVYQDEYETEKLEYDKSMKAYHNSPSYQAYMLSKNRPRGGEKAVESGVFIQPVDECEGEAGQYSLKQIAASRFHRNHRLMREIFGETQVPDARNVITAQRLGVLKKQVNSLTLHQNKLEDELKQLEAKFESKKRKMAESGAQFSANLKKLCSHKMEPFEELVEKSKAYLLNAFERYTLQERKQREELSNGEQRPVDPCDGQLMPASGKLEPDVNQSGDPVAAQRDDCTSEIVGDPVGDHHPSRHLVTQGEAPQPSDLAERSGKEANAVGDEADITKQEQNYDRLAVQRTTHDLQKEISGDARESGDGSGETDELKGEESGGENNEASSSLPPDDSSENSQEA